MDLFDFENPEGINKLGFRLQKLEIYNWGTFHNKVWTLNLNGDTSLLTGDVGSGKSTLVDALSTLLVPPRKVMYNKAADASAKERNLTSYVRGYYGQKRTREGGGQPESLRNPNQYSVILATFSDINLGEVVTLAQVFWFKDEQRWPARFFVLADKTLLITEHFSNFGSDIKNLKKRLDRDHYIHIYEDYPPYAREFRHRFGIRQAQAMDLFQQTISMKKVDELTSFVRQNMLEVPDTVDDVKNLLGHFYDLDMAHQTVLKAKNQQELLRPLVELGKTYDAAARHTKQLQLMQLTLKSWFAEKENQLLLDEVTDLTDDLQETEQRCSEQTVILQGLETELNTIFREMDQNGGRRLETLQLEIRQDKQQLASSKKALENYNRQADLLGFAAPVSKTVFHNNREQLIICKKKEEDLSQELAEELADYEISRNEVEKERKQIGEELESLRLRQSSIPREYIEIRNRLCYSLDLAVSEMPFIGELIEVKNTESDWEGAIEQLLHTFGLALLIPDSHYTEVVSWIEKTPLHLRFVYYRIVDEVVTISKVNDDGIMVYTKLNFKRDARFSDWVQGEVYKRFRHICAETVQEFKNADYALTKGGQIKTGKQRHEKDDRHSLNDQRRYILGFSNQKKILLLEQEIENLTGEVKRWKKLSREIKIKQIENQKRITAIAIVTEVTEFETIDCSGIETQILAKMQRLTELEHQNETLQILKEKQEQLTSLKENAARILNMTNKHLYQNQLLLEQKNAKMKVNRMLADQVEATIQKQAYPYLEANYKAALEDKKINLLEITSLENTYAIWISAQLETASCLLAETATSLTRLMTQFSGIYPQETMSIDAAPEAVGEYEKILQHLELDDLPRFETKFRDLLKENTINQIALFHGKLELACAQIRERIDMINHSLNAIDYNDGRYIQIEYTVSAEHEIKQFRMQLKSCTDSALANSDDEQYTEEKFNQIREILDRFRGRANFAEEDQHWMDKVIDVRNWYTFAASEKWRETDEEYEHYTDSSGKSGGQKEKLAYTILAASLVYNFGLEAKNKRIQSFRFVVIDEAFLKSSDDSARFGLELFKKLDLQLLVVTPLLKIATIEPFVTHVGFVYQNEEQHHSYLRNLTIKELKQERAVYRQIER
ncbi:Uncharacterized protein YPO0396 [Propionispira arboris]|uniref:Uncharacterized protein YPO0396 n=1 Tax=Propionispira arboris TaxID=84035 RepID=A0A1H6Z2U6_9FIRM|nr:ATP-binding protein [Propionispira arboris]SEJ43870.1 Uncharacterized protein YPO0396 [Propionispira arboris]